ncbi:MAG: hypothetical protein WAM70_17140 [Pyrinomonadaceae bacterium]
MSKPTKIIFAVALALLVLSYPTCQWGERTVRHEMAKYPADFVAAHEFDWIFFRWALPGIGMFFLGGFLTIVAIVFWIVGRSTAKRKLTPRS